MVAVWYSSTGERLEYSSVAHRATLDAGPPSFDDRRRDAPPTFRSRLGPDGRGLVVWDENTGPNVNGVRMQRTLGAR